MKLQTEVPTPLLERHVDGIRELCRTHHVKSLHAFGSVLRSDFGPESDVDFLVVFDRTHGMSAFLQFFTFKEELEALLGRKIDLVTYNSIRNPFFKHAVEETKLLVYAA